MKCIEKKPKDRFQSAAALEKALEGEEKPVEVAGSSEEIAVPLHLARWQRSDWYVLGAAAVSVLMFFLLFDRAYPYSASVPRFDRVVAAARAREILAKLPVVPRQIGFAAAATGNIQDYDDILLYGSEEVHDRNRYQQSLPRITFDGDARGELWLDENGMPWGLTIRGFSDSAPPREEAVRIATTIVGKLFGIDLAGASPQFEESQSKLGGNTLGITWNLPSSSAEAERTTIVVWLGKQGVVAAWRYRSLSKQSSTYLVTHEDW